MNFQPHIPFFHLYKNKHMAESSKYVLKKNMQNLNITVVNK